MKTFDIQKVQSVLEEADAPSARVRIREIHLVKGVQEYFDKEETYKPELKINLTDK